MAAPFVGNYSAEELELGREFVKDWNPQTIQAAYLGGRISLGDKADLLRTYGQITHELRVREYTGTAPSIAGAFTGEVQNYAMGVATQFQKAWENANNTHAKTAVLHGLIGGLQAFGYTDIPGNTMERWALGAGMEPSYARALNWAVWIPSSFFGTTALLKLPFKAVGMAYAGSKALPTITKDWVMSFSKDPAKHAVEESMKLDAKVIAAMKANISKGETAAAKAVGEKAGEAKSAAAKFAEEFTGPIEPISPQQIEEASKEGLINLYEEKAKAFIRKGVSHTQTEAESIRKMSLAELLKRPPEKGASAAEMAYMGRVNTAVQRGLEDSLKEGMEHFDDLVAGNRPDLLENFRMHLQVLQETNPRFLGARGEGGRMLEYMKQLAGETAAAQSYHNILNGLGAEALGDGNTATVTTVMQRLALMAPDSRKIFLDASAKAKSPGMIHTLFKTLLFASPAGWAGNLVGQTTMALGDAVQFTAAAMTPFKSEGAATMREAVAMWAGIGNASRNMPRILRQAMERSAHATTEKMGLEGTKGAAEAIAQHGPMRILGLTDELIGGFTESGYIQYYAVKEALEKGIKPGKALNDAVTATLSNPEEVSRIAELVKPLVQHAMAHDPLSPFGETVTKAIRNSKVDYLLPVLKWPINALKISRDWSPGLQFLSKSFLDDIAAGGTREAAARARVALTWMATQFLWGEAKSGNLTGGGPRNPEANKAWQQADKKNVPYSWRGFSYRWAEPFASSIGFVADLAQMSNEIDPDKLDDALAVFMLASGRMITNNFFLRTINSIHEIAGGLMTNPTPAKFGYAAGRFALQPAKTVISGGPLGKQITEWFSPKAADTQYYDADGWDNVKNWVTAGTPWGTDGRPRLDLDGNPMILPPVLGQRWANTLAPPIRYSVNQESKTAQFLTKHGVTINDDWDNGPGSVNPDVPLQTPSLSPVRTNLSGEQAYKWKELSLKVAERGTVNEEQAAQGKTGKTWQERIAELDNDPGFNAMTQPKKQERVSRVYNQYKEKSGWKLLLELDPEVKAKAEAAHQETRARKGGVVMPQSEDLIDDGSQHPVEYVPVEPTPPDTSSSHDSGQIRVPTQ